MTGCTAPARPDGGRRSLRRRWSGFCPPSAPRRVPSTRRDGLPCRRRGVDEVEVDVVQPCLGERSLDGFLGFLVPHGLGWDFAGEEHVLSLQTGLVHRRGTGRFVAIHTRRVDMAVSGFESVECNLLAHFGWGLVHAIAKDGDAVA